jgi:hypothetical protein
MLNPDENEALPEEDKAEAVKEYERAIKEKETIRNYHKPKNQGASQNQAPRLQPLATVITNSSQAQKIAYPPHHNL